MKTKIKQCDRNKIFNFLLDNYCECGQIRSIREIRKFNDGSIEFTAFCKKCDNVKTFNIEGKTFQIKNDRKIKENEKKWIKKP